MESRRSKMAAPVRQRRRRQGCCQGRPNRQQQLAAASQKPNRQTRAKTHWPRRAWGMGVQGCARVCIGWVSRLASAANGNPCARCAVPPASSIKKSANDQDPHHSCSFIVSSNFPLRSKEQPSPRQERWTWWSLPDVHKYRTGQPRASILPCLCLAGCSGSSFRRCGAFETRVRLANAPSKHLPPSISLVESGFILLAEQHRLSPLLTLDAPNAHPERNAKGKVQVEPQACLLAPKLRSQLIKATAPVGGPCDPSSAPLPSAFSDSRLSADCFCLSPILFL